MSHVGFEIALLKDPNRLFYHLLFRLLTNLQGWQTVEDLEKIDPVLELVVELSFVVVAGLELLEVAQVKVVGAVDLE